MSFANVIISGVHCAASISKKKCKLNYFLTLRVPSNLHQSSFNYVFIF